MAHDQQAANDDNPWPRFSWWFTAALLVVSLVLGFVVLGRYQQNGPALDFWTAICRAAGLTSESRATGAPQPPLRTPTRIAWTRDTLAQIGSGDAHRGAFIALNCGACHGEQGISASSLIPTLAGMDAAVIYKQLDDYRSGKRPWGVMSAIAAALSPQDSADVAAYFAGRADGLRPVAGEPLPEGGRSLRQVVRPTRLVFAGDPARGIPPCGACHGPGDHKLGAPSLNGQHPEYIERQLAAFAQGIRQNDINQQMRVIAAQLAPDEMHEVALFYSAAGSARTAEKLAAWQSDQARVQ
jgi:cytochrome c553